MDVSAQSSDLLPPSWGAVFLVLVLVGGGRRLVRTACPPGAAHETAGRGQAKRDDAADEEERDGDDRRRRGQVVPLARVLVVVVAVPGAAGLLRPGRVGVAVLVEDVQAVGRERAETRRAVGTAVAHHAAPLEPQVRELVVRHAEGLDVEVGVVAEGRGVRRERGVGAQEEVRLEAEHEVSPVGARRRADVVEAVLERAVARDGLLLADERRLRLGDGARERVGVAGFFVVLLGGQPVGEGVVDRQVVRRLVLVGADLVPLPILVAEEVGEEGRRHPLERRRRPRADVARAEPVRRADLVAAADERDELHRREAELRGEPRLGVVVGRREPVAVRDVLEVAPAARDAQQVEPRVPEHVERDDAADDRRVGLGDARHLGLDVGERRRRGLDARVLRIIELGRVEERAAVAPGRPRRDVVGRRRVEGGAEEERREADVVVVFVRVGARGGEALEQEGDARVVGARARRERVEPRRVKERCEAGALGVAEALPPRFVLRGGRRDCEDEAQQDAGEAAVRHARQVNRSSGGEPRCPL
mmetsp:Transcript_17910/g.71795  ORF Transcript_17910/g.71795 Transcript_17910/m.71795 type:complete len:533 (-) Transcript_17910:100-1698(-)